MQDDITLDISDGIATLLFDCIDEKVNKLSANVLNQLNQIIHQIKEDASITCLLVKSAKKDIFIAGADIAEIQDIQDVLEAQEKVRLGQTVLNQFAELPFPTVAAINGACLGGGLEFALACDFRVVSDNPKAQCGQPEINLGIIPGFGGTQRLPRLIGLQKGLGLILSGKSILGKKAYKLGLVDEFFSAAFFDERVLAFSKSLVDNSVYHRLINRQKKRSIVEILLETNLIGRTIIFKQARAAVLKKTKGHYPAPLAAIRAIKYGFSRSLNKGLNQEINEFSKLVVTDISKNLIQLFYTQEKLKKETWVDNPQRSNPIENAGVLGAGLMGGGIAWLLGYRGISVRLKDISWTAIQMSYQTMKKIYSKLKAIGRVKAYEAELGLSRVSCGTSYMGFSTADIVIEAIIESPEIKKKVYKDLEEKVSKSSIIATNTSSLSVNELSSDLNYPERFIGMHFFSPVNRMPLVEVIPGDKTNKETIETTVQFAKALKKVPILVKNCPGFLINRILLPYINEAAYLVESGVPIQKVDHIMETFGMPIGPLSLADEVGLDVGYSVLKTLEEGYGQRMAICPLLEKMKRTGKFLGRKSGHGFYNYRGTHKTPNNALNLFITGVSNNPLKTPGMCLDRMVLIMVNEALKCLEEGIISDVKYLDMAMIMGTGFPAFRGGICRYAEQRGFTEIYNVLTELNRRLGDRFMPTQYLDNLVQRKQLLYVR